MILIFQGCKELNSESKNMNAVEKGHPLVKKVYIQPLGRVQEDYMQTVTAAVIEFYGYDVIVRPQIDFSDDILTRSKTRYDASKILAKFSSKENLIIITERDIAIKNEKRNAEEWGILGLGQRPGTICVISTYRMKRNVSAAKIHERLKKVALHEIGHNLGLKHCTTHPECMMNDADGTIKQVDKEKIWFCNACRAKIS